MAVGFSGSNGGVVDGKSFLEIDLLSRPLEVSYFVNNVCNLKCKHCYVGYEEKGGELSVEEWKDTFDKFIKRGALTFGNVGKEPLLSSEKTLDLLRHFGQKRQKDPRLRFGFVTNGTLLKGKVVEDLAEISPDYIDVSLDGTEKEHDYIRGKGNYLRTVKNLRGLPEKLKKKIFVSYTLMDSNKDSFGKMVRNMSNSGLTKFLISPYVPTPSSNGELALNEEEIVDFYQRLIHGQEIDYKGLQGIEVLLKVDYDSQKSLMDRLVKRGVINVNDLLVDDYGVLFNRHPQEKGSEVVVNYMPFSDTLSRAVRISHDGYVSGCLEMFHKDYPERARANLREKCLDEVLKI